VEAQVPARQELHDRDFGERLSGGRAEDQKVASMHIKQPRALLGLVVVLSLSLLAAGPASARIPKFNPNTIVTGQAIGGVKIGMTKKQAVAVWGKPDRCRKEETYPGDFRTFCEYVARSSLGGSTPIPFARFVVRSGRVILVDVESAENAAADSKVNKLKTSKGIGIGSKMSAARKAYKLGPPSGGEAGQSRALYKQKSRCTLFYAPQSPYTKIESISVGKCDKNGNFI
jgi:hypothetical protein